MKLINLLPKTRQIVTKQFHIYSSLKTVFMFSLFFLSLPFMAQFFLHFYLTNEIDRLENEIKIFKKTDNSKQNAEIKKKVEYVNNLVTDFYNLAIDQPKWSKVVRAFAPLPPEGVSIQSMNVDLNKKTIRVNGKSPNRDLVIRFYNNVMQSKDFKEINYPLENIAEEENINFYFTFSIAEALYK